MERLTKRLEGGEYVSERGEAELLAELGRYEDFFESIEAEHELIRLNLETCCTAVPLCLKTCKNGWKSPLMRSTRGWPC